MRAMSLGLLLAMAAGPCWAGHGGCDGPSQQVLRIGSDGSLTLTCQVSKPVFETKEYVYTVKVPVTVEKERLVNGKPETYQVTEYREESRTATKTVMRLVFEQIQRQMALDSITAFETDGRKISLADLKRRCQGDTLVVVSGDDAMVPDYYAAVFKPGTIILAAPPQVYAYPAPNEAPPPPGEAPQRPQASLSPLAVHTVSHQTVVAESQENPRLPASPAPELVFASRDGADLVKLRQFTETKFETQVTVRANDSSVSPEKMLKAQRTVRHSENTHVPWNAVRISTPEGGDVPADRVKERLGAGETTVLLSGDGKLVDAFWLQNIKPSVLVFRGVQLGGGMAHYAMPVPMSAQAPPAPIEAQLAPPPAATPLPQPVAP